MFAVAFVGQTLVAVSQVFILSVPARLAAVWFGPKEVSSACSIGVFGNQVSAAPHISLTAELLAKVMPYRASSH
jgi:FLVCR family feline leukemia virus subgroup C receptor-related protein